MRLPVRLQDESVTAGPAPRPPPARRARARRATALLGLWAPTVRRLARHGPAALAALLLAAWVDARAGGALAGVTLATAGLAWFLVPPLGLLLRRWRVVVRPGGRSEHRGSVPLLGGLAVFLPFALVASVLAAHGSPKALGLLAGATLVAGVGLLDDLRGVRPSAKVAAQVLAALGLAAGGFTLTSLGIPGLGRLDLGAAALPALVFWVVLATNAFNLIDGMDGLAAGVATVALLGLAVLGVHPLLVLPLAGALLGFLPHNLPRARIFLGDTGSLFLGFVLAALLLELPASANLPLAVGLLAYPLGDVACTVARRLVRGKPLFRPDRGHVHHRFAVHLGGRVPALTLLWALSAATAAVAVRAPGVAFLAAFLLLWGGQALLLVGLARVRLGHLLRGRKAFQELHLLRDYVEGRLRLAATAEEVHRALERMLTDLGLAEIHLGGVSLLNGGHGDPRCREEHVRLPGRAARWAYVPGEAEEESYSAERETVVVDVLRRADARLRRLAAVGA